MTKDEINFLNEPQGDHVSLENRLVRYLNDLNSEAWTDPLEIGKQPNLMQRPFNFYGEMVALSHPQRESFAEDQLVNYYKCIIKDMSEAKDSLIQEADHLTFMSVDYRTKMEKLQVEKADLIKQVDSLKKKLAKEIADAEKRIAGMNNQNFKKSNEIKKERAAEKEIFDQELKLSEKIREELQI